MYKEKGDKCKGTGSFSFKTSPEARAKASAKRQNKARLQQEKKRRESESHPSIALEIYQALEAIDNGANLPHVLRNISS